MIRSRRGVITVGIVVFVFGLIALFPARVAIGWFAPPTLLINNIRGSAWAGGASEASIDGLYLKNIRWDMNLLRLLTGRLSYDISATPGSGFFESEVQFGSGGKLSLLELKAAMPLQLFAGVAGVSGLQGNTSLDFERVELVDGLAVHADGVIRIANLVIPVLGGNSLGGYEAEFSTQDNAVVASLEDTDGVVDLAGSLQIQSDRSYRFMGQVMVKSETPQLIRQRLKQLPPPNERGQYELRLQGVL